MFDNAVYAPDSVTPVSFIQASLAAGLYDIGSGSGGAPDTLTLGFSNGVQTTTPFAINVAPEPSAFVGLDIGLGGLAIKARRRTA